MTFETSDKSFLTRIGKYQKKTLKEVESGDRYCNYHQPPLKKVQCGKYLFCPECRNRRLPSGKPIR